MTNKKISIKSYLNIFWHMLKTDFLIYKDAITDGFVDATIWFVSTILIFAYVFPAIGMQQTFGPFMAVTSIVSCSFWDIWATSTIFISDMEGNKTINYFLTLPIPHYFVFIKQILGYALKAGIPSLVILPLGKIFLWKQLDLTHFSVPKFILIYILINIFVGAFSLLITSTIKDLHHMGKVGIRFLFPLWSFGGAFYSYKIISTLSPKLGYLNLTNPLLYAMEGIRAAVLGQNGSMNFWLCVIMLTAFTILFAWWGIFRLKKRLDLV